MKSKVSELCFKQGVVSRDDARPDSIKLFLCHKFADRHGNC